MFIEDELLPLSGLQHLLFCERQFALIQIEQAWAENRFTAEGRIMHERVDTPGSVSRRNVRVAYGVPLRSLRLGLSGKADVVEFHRREEPLEPESTAYARSIGGIDSSVWLPFPVEYKRGRPKAGPWDVVQLCAQALCLEEMLATDVPAGALFYGQTRRRQEVDFDVALRGKTKETATRMHQLFEQRETPRAEYAKKCERCSLIEICQPKITTGGRSAQSYLQDLFSDSMSADI